jgi:DNA-binding NarL/FixJ family response regulator
MSDGEHSFVSTITSSLAEGVCPPSSRPRSARIDLAQLWRDLACGALTIQTISHTEKLCSLTLERRSPQPSSTLSERRFAILQRVLLGESPKEIAFSVGLAVSTIALACRECLEGIGTQAGSLRSPIVLVMAAHAAAGFEYPPSTASHEAIGATSFTVSVVRPDLELRSRLSGAEYQVVRLLVEGYAYAAMAERRAGSVRTVANQIASAFRKLKVSGRSSLMAALARGSCFEQAERASAPAPAAATSDVRELKRNGPPSARAQALLRQSTGDEI